MNLERNLGYSVMLALRQHRFVFQLWLVIKRGQQNCGGSFGGYGLTLMVDMGGCNELRWVVWEMVIWLGSNPSIALRYTPGRTP